MSPSYGLGARPRAPKAPPLMSIRAAASLVVGLFACGGSLPDASDPAPLHPCDSARPLPSTALPTKRLALELLSKAALSPSAAASPMHLGRLTVRSDDSSPSFVSGGRLPAPPLVLLSWSELPLARTANSLDGEAKARLLDYADKRLKLANANSADSGASESCRVARRGELLASQRELVIALDGRQDPASALILASLPDSTEGCAGVDCDESFRRTLERALERSTLAQRQFSLEDPLRWYASALRLRYLAELGRSTEATEEANWMLAEAAHSPFPAGELELLLGKFVRPNDELAFYEAAQRKAPSSSPIVLYAIALQIDSNIKKRNPGHALKLASELAQLPQEQAGELAGDILVKLLPFMPDWYEHELPVVLEEQFAEIAFALAASASATGDATLASSLRELALNYAPTTAAAHRIAELAIPPSDPATRVAGLVRACTPPERGLAFTLLFDGGTTQLGGNNELPSDFQRCIQAESKRFLRGLPTLWAEVDWELR